METFEEHYNAMCAAIARRMPTADMDLIDRAVHYADEKHKHQQRKDGSPYIIHPLAVAEIVVEMGLDMDAILGALLHDCIEDTDASHEEIEKLHGANENSPRNREIKVRKNEMKLRKKDFEVPKNFSFAPWRFPISSLESGHSM